MKKKILGIVVGVLIADFLFSACAGAFMAMFAGALENGAGVGAEPSGMVLVGLMVFAYSFVAGLKLALAALVVLGVAYVIGGIMVRWLRPESKKPDGDKTPEQPRQRRINREIKVVPPVNEAMDTMPKYKLNQLMYLLQQARGLVAQGGGVPSIECGVLLEEAKEACLLAGMTMSHAEPQTIIRVLDEGIEKATKAISLLQAGLDPADPSSGERDSK